MLSSAAFLQTSHSTPANHEHTSPSSEGKQEGQQDLTAYIPQSKEKNGFLAVTLKWHNWKCQVVLLTDDIKIHSVLHEIQLLFALSKHGYFPAKVSAASAPGCEITCLILQVQRSLSVLPAIPRITFVCPGSLCTSSPCLPQSWLFSEWVTSVSVPGEAAPISMVPESPLSEFFPIPYPNHSEESNEFFHEVFS